MHVPPEVKHQVGFLCVEIQGKRGTQRVPIGTCFWVLVHNKQRDVGFGYLVTAKHVYEKLHGYANVYVRLNKLVTKQGETGITYVPLPDNWMFHPDPTVDLAVLPWPAAIMPNPNFQFVCFTLEEIAHIPETTQKEGLPWPPNEGEDVIYVGLMTQYSGYERNFPVIRRGHIALVTDEPVQGRYGLSNYYFIDMQIYPGHSGGPVWIVYPTKETGMTMSLLGVLSAGHPVRQELLTVPKEQKQHKAAKQEVVAYYNMGISMVVPTSRIVEILGSEEAEEMREKDKPKPVKPAPAEALPPSDVFTRSDFEAALRKAARRFPSSESDSKKK